MHLHRGVRGVLETEAEGGLPRAAGGVGAEGAVAKATVQGLVDEAPGADEATAVGHALLGELRARDEAVPVEEVPVAVGADPEAPRPVAVEHPAQTRGERAAHASQGDLLRVFLRALEGALDGGAKRREAVFAGGTIEGARVHARGVDAFPRPDNGRGRSG